MRIDLNADVGESLGAWALGEDEALIPLVSSVNVAAGFHAGDPVTIERTIALAVRSGAAVGRPSRATRTSPGSAVGRWPCPRPRSRRRSSTRWAPWPRSPRRRATTLRHVKAHGALYNRAARDPEAASGRCSRRAALLAVARPRGPRRVRARGRGPGGRPCRRRGSLRRSRVRSGRLAARVGTSRAPSSTTRQPRRRRHSPSSAGRSRPRGGNARGPRGHHLRPRRPARRRGPGAGGPGGPARRGRRDPCPRLRRVASRAHRSSSLGDDAVLVDLGEPASIAAARRAQALARAVATLRAGDPRLGVPVPGAASVLVPLDVADLDPRGGRRGSGTARDLAPGRTRPPRRTPASTGSPCATVAPTARISPTSPRQPGRTVGDGRGRSTPAPSFEVLFLGFAPGFAYLGELPDALVVPRLATPRTRVPAGSVAVADRFTAVYPAASAGWLADPGPDGRGAVRSGRGPAGAASGRATGSGSCPR